MTTVRLDGLNRIGSLSDFPSQVPSLLEALRQVPDERRKAGMRYSLASVLAFICCAYLCGAKSIIAMFEWGRAHQNWCLTVFGFKHRTPCTSTLHLILKQTNLPVFEQIVHDWMLPQFYSDSSARNESEIIAIDGKSLRGIKNSSERGTRLLSAFACNAGVILAQDEIPVGHNEITQAPKLLKRVNLKNNVVTADAMNTQRELCKQILEQGGDYLLAVKDNQKGLYRNISKLFVGEVDSFAHASTTDCKHGRIELRSLHTQPFDNKFHQWPGVQQVCRLLHQVRRNGKWTVKDHYRITSLSPQQASAEDLLKFSRQHWDIENRVHYVRDASLGEDASRIRTGKAPYVMAVVRNLVINLIRHAKFKYTRTGMRHYSWHIEQAARVLGL